MKLFKNKIPIEELILIKSEKRKKAYHQGKRLKGIKIRKKIHFLCWLILIIDQLTSKEKIKIIKDKRIVNKKNKRPKIFACTHCGGNDIQRALQVIRKPAYLMLGDPGELYKMFIYNGLKLNGVIPLETGDKEDRLIAYNRAVELLSAGGNLLIFPEGAWNVTPNLAVMKIFKGAVKMAKETGAEIVPIALEQYGNDFYINVGEDYSISENTLKTDEELKNELRDKLATLKWEIYENREGAKRRDFNDDYLDFFQNRIIDRCNFGYGFTLEDAIRESFHEKYVTSNKEAFECISNIHICSNNCFLLDKRLKGIY